VPASDTSAYHPITLYLSRPEVSMLLRRSLKYIFRRRPQVRISRDVVPGQLLVSVIIATYNWSNVLRMAIHSVLWQTEQNFELLVIGDGCTDDSEEVARSFGDARIHWHNLPVNSGNQSAPNNAGLALARGRYIAFLGHDDIWHPDHLRTMLSALTSARADVASSLVEMIGPAGTNCRFVTGIYPNGNFDPDRGLPPSGLFHKREVAERVGSWKHYRTVARVPEAEFVYQAFLQGFRFVSTGELTVFKFNSAFRRDSYVEKPCHEQAAYLERILKQRFFLLREVLGIAWIHLRRLPMRAPAVAAPPSPNTPGWYVTQFRKIRGLE
jgi:glycosyltransferase involved in cell wall biosynthesis